MSDLTVNDPDVSIDTEYKYAIQRMVDGYPTDDVAHTASNSDEYHRRPCPNPKISVSRLLLSLPEADLVLCPPMFNTVVACRFDHDWNLSVTI